MNHSGSLHGNETWHTGHANSSHDGLGHDHSSDDVQVVYVIGLVLSPLIVLENSLSFYAVKKVRNIYPALKVLLLNLNVADISLGVCFGLSNTLAITHALDSVTAICFARILAVAYLMLVVLAIATCICLERFLSLSRPLQYSSLSTRWSHSVLIALVWALPALVIMAAFSGEPIDEDICHVKGQRTFFVLASARLIQLATITFVQIWIYYLAKKQVNKIGHQVMWKDKKTTMARLNQKLTRAIRISITPYELMCLPHIVVTWIVADDPSKIYQPEWHVAMASAALICVAHGLVHPLTYCFTLSSVRREIHELCACWGRRGQVLDESTVIPSTDANVQRSIVVSTLHH